MARLPKVKLKAIPVFPSTVEDGIGIAVTKANGAYSIDLDVSDFHIANVADEDEATMYAVSWGGVTDDNPDGAFQLTPFSSLQGASDELTSLDELDAIGLVARIGDADYVARTLTAGTGLGVTNGDAVAGNPTVAITDVELLAIAGLTSAADKLPYFTGSGTAALTDFSAFGRSLVDDADASAARTTLGLTSPATTTPAALTRTNDTNVTLTLGGTPTTALLQATSITVGWSGTLAASRGGFGADVSGSSGVPLFAAGTPTFTSTTGTGDFVRANGATMVAPALGAATATTAAVDDNSTKVATTAMVLGQAAAATPLGNNPTAAVGTSTRYARADHVHPGREVLTAGRTYYVRTDGSDSNTGLVNSSGGAFLTIQKAIDVTAALDMSVYQVIIQLGNGTYTVAGQTLKTYVGALPPIIVGDETTLTNVVVSNSGTAAFASDGVPPWKIRGMQITSPSSGRGLYAINGGTIYFRKVNFGAGNAGVSQIQASYGGRIITEGDYTVAGGGAWHLLATNFGQILTFNSATVTVSGTPAFSQAFAQAGQLANIYTSGTTWSGSATGVRYSSTQNSVIDTGSGASATYFPGNSAGSTGTGGLYS